MEPCVPRTSPSHHQRTTNPRIDWTSRPSIQEKIQEIDSKKEFITRFQGLIIQQRVLWTTNHLNYMFTCNSVWRILQNVTPDFNRLSFDLFVLWSLRSSCLSWNTRSIQAERPNGTPSTFEIYAVDDSLNGDWSGTRKGLGLRGFWSRTGRRTKLPPRVLRSAR